MPVIACPQCAAPLPAAGGPCGACGLDAALILEIRQTAEALARQAANLAAAGAWQEAYHAGAESLRLVREPNDLAAFVLLVAALAGAQGFVQSVPRPRAEALPEPLAEWVEPVLTAADRLRSLGQAGDAADIEKALARLDPRHPLLPRRPSRTFGRAATAALLLCILAGAVGRWSGVASTRQVAQNRAAALTDTLRTPARPATPAGASAEQKPRAVTPEPVIRPSPVAVPHPQIQGDVSRRLWLAGHAASARGRYDEARQWLELAVLGPRDSYYWPSAAFFLGKEYLRLHRIEDAKATYRLLESEAPRSPYLPHARRLLARIEKGQGVDG